MTQEHHLIPMAICYDFDGTLAPGNMQEYGFIGELGMTPQNFWSKSNKMAQVQKADGISAYMKMMKEESSAHDLPFKRADFQRYASQVQLFDGVDTWFTRLNAYALQKGIALEHYIISSGLKEMVEGTSIASHFKEIFASSFMYDANGVAVWPGLVVNYTNKTQFLYRINKGCLDVSDNESVNRHMNDEDKPMPFAHMIYIGDGETDIPSMKTVKREGGHTIAVYNEKIKGQRQKVKSLLGIDRADVIAPANYQEGKQIDLFVKGIMEKIIADVHLNHLKIQLNQ